MLHAPDPSQMLSRLPDLIRPRRLLTALEAGGRRLYRAWRRRGLEAERIGAVEGAWPGDDLTGWVRADVWADRATPVIGVYRVGLRVGLTVAIAPVGPDGARLSFAVHVDGGHVARDLASGDLTVHLLRDGRPLARIPLAPDLAEALRARAALDFLDHVAALPEPAHAATLERLRALLGEGAANHPGLSAAGTLGRARALFDRTAGEPVSDPARAWRRCSCRSAPARGTGPRCSGGTARSFSSAAAIGCWRSTPAPTTTPARVRSRQRGSR